MVRELFVEGKLQVTLQRLAHQILECHPDMYNTCILGIQPRGVFLSRRLQKILCTLLPSSPLECGEIDVTFYRDDFRRQQTPLLPNTTQVDFIIENKDVILVDDVLYTGRTVRAAMDAMLAFGRPANVELLVLVDRKRKRELPIEADYTGIAVETLDSERVIVEWTEEHGADSVRFQSKIEHD